MSRKHELANIKKPSPPPAPPQPRARETAGFLKQFKITA